MKVFLTGATSFTGYWIARVLAKSGHELTMPIRCPVESYDGVRADRAKSLRDFGRVVVAGDVGSDRFIELLESESNWDAFAHHAAQVGNYRSPDFDVTAATAANTRGLNRALEAFSSRGGRRIIATGSVFEGGEGAGSDGCPSFSAYGLSKLLTWKIIEFFASRHGIACGKFVIPNPFGPFEEPRFTAYLVKTWAGGKVASVRTPDYVRDNIHVSLLALAYRRFLEAPWADGVEHRSSPSGYVESQGRFAERFAREMSSRLGLECGLELLVQSEFDEPRIRIGTDPVAADPAEWSEAEAWDGVAEYYSLLLDQVPAP